MITTAQNTSSFSIAAKLRDYHQLAKTRLTFTVVLSALFGYLLASGASVNWTEILALTIGGFLVVASSNGLNQVIEKNFDALMLRTNNRPLATNRMSVSEAVIFCAAAGIIGVYTLTHYLNEMSGWLGLFALLSYAFLYTPLKRHSSLAVFVGAFPGAIPPLLGWVAATGSIGTGAWILFAIQFVWQFPHFWAIAWILDEDYRRAGYKLLPSRQGKDKRSVKLMLWYIGTLLPLTASMYFLGITGWISLIVSTLAGLIFLYQGVKLYKSCSTADAKKLMFYSIIYNPVVLLVFILDKVS